MRRFWKETMTRRERDMEAAQAMDRAITLYVDPCLDAMGLGRTDDEGRQQARHRFRMDMLETMKQVVNKLAVSEERAKWGMETRLGHHDRVVKMRRGVRHEDSYECTTEWFVVPMMADETDWLARTRAELEAEGFDDHWTNSGKTYLRDMMDEAIATLVKDHYGVAPYPSSCLASYSPTGKMFSTVYTRQVGRRLLVQWSHQRDV